MLKQIGIFGTQVTDTKCKKKERLARETLRKISAVLVSHM